MIYSCSHTGRGCPDSSCPQSLGLLSLGVHQPSSKYMERPPLFQASARNAILLPVPWPETHPVPSLTARGAGRRGGVRAHSLTMNVWRPKGGDGESLLDWRGNIFKDPGTTGRGCLGNCEPLRGAAVTRARKEGGVGGGVVVRVGLWVRLERSGCRDQRARDLSRNLHEGSRGLSREGRATGQKRRGPILELSTSGIQRPAKTWGEGQESGQFPGRLGDCHSLRWVSGRQLCGEMRGSVVLLPRMQWETSF